jgi:hypothetical protein
MVKRFLASFIFFVTAGLSDAQDMPPLPPMNNDATVSSNSNTSAPALPPLPDQQATPANNASPAMPPLPDQQAAPANSGSPELPPLSANSISSAPANNAAPAMPPLSDRSGAPAPSSAAPALSPASSEVTPAAPAATAEPAAPAEAASSTVKPGKKAAKQSWWTKTKKRANVIFSGWVNPKGGNESSRIAWTSQEVLNALLFKGYKVIKEDGKYDGQAEAGGNQWREFTFSIPKSKLTTQVYLKQVGKKVWLRFGPSEPPAFAKEENTVANVKEMREANMKVLRLVQRKLGRRLSPHRIIRSWEAPYSFAQESVVE